MGIGTGGDRREGGGGRGLDEVDGVVMAEGCMLVRLAVVSKGVGLVW